MNVFIRLSVKNGHEVTDITCGVPWPSIRSLYPDDPLPPNAVELNPTWTKHINAFVLDLPVLKLDRAPDPATPATI